MTPEHAAQPVFIFLPTHSQEQMADDIVVDPVCGRALARHTIAGRLSHNGRDNYFCSLRCAERFAADPDDHVAR